MQSAIRNGADRLALTFFGGEPLLEKETLFDILEQARDLERSSGTPVTAKVSTNGILVDEDFVREAGRTGLFVSLSIDGVKAAQDAGRSMPDGGSSFRAANEALQFLAAARKPFAVYSVITPQNVPYLAASVDYLWDAGARVILSAIDYTSSWDDRSLRVLGRQYALMGRLYRQLLQRGEYFHLEPFDSRIPQRTRAGEWTRCAPGTNQVVVSPEGILHGCIEYYERVLLPLGSASAWLDPRQVRRLSRSRSMRPAACGSCGIKDRCNNSCSCINLRGTDYAGRPPRSLCVAEQETTLAADAIGAELYKKKVPEFLLRNYSCSYSLLSAIQHHIDTTEVGYG